jgi:hypothetical protein
MNRRFFTLLLVTTTMIIATQPHVVAQLSCHVVNLRFQHPATARAGEMIQTSSIVTASCFHYATVILDLVDSGSNKILSRVQWWYDPLMSPVSPVLVNYARAPNLLGYWALSIHAYFAGSSTGLQFTIFIEPSS